MERQSDTSSDDWSEPAEEKSGKDYAKRRPISRLVPDVMLFT